MVNFSAIVRAMAAPTGSSESPAADAQRTLSTKEKQVRRTLFSHFSTPKFQGFARTFLCLNYDAACG
jgi:hypothetical protein